MLDGRNPSVVQAQVMGKIQGQACGNDPLLSPLSTMICSAAPCKHVCQDTRRGAAHSQLMAMANKELYVPLSSLWKRQSHGRIAEVIDSVVVH